jgi:hypothetical protein
MGEPERGYDGDRRLAGRKRHPLPDAGGLVLGARVHTARWRIRNGRRVLCKRELKTGLPMFAVVRADAAYTE